jgi:hypothetical protein
MCWYPDVSARSAYVVGEIYSDEALASDIQDFATSGLVATIDDLGQLSDSLVTPSFGNNHSWNLYCEVLLEGSGVL